MAERAREYGLEVHYYPINHYLKGSTFYFVSAGFIKGPLPAVRRCFVDLKKLKRAKNGRRVAELETSKNNFLCVTAHKLDTEQQKLVRFFYNPSVIHLKPAVIFPDGHEEWEVCAFKKQHLDKIIRIGERLYGLEVISLRRSPVSTVGIVAAAPYLSKRQISALEIGIRDGYYSYPRRASLRNLADKTSLSLSTFQAHLRKAENKLIPFLFARC